MSQVSSVAHRLVASLNDEQRKIACTLDRPLFVAAGAGSGKTFTLTRRIAWALSPGSGEDGRPYLDSIDQVLVITFTEAAAREIRERVRQTLRKEGAYDERLRTEALAVDRAWISTIHGMCSRILHRHALDLGLDPNFAVASENESAELLYTAMDQVMGRASRNPAYRDLIDTYEVGGFSVTNSYSGTMGLVSAARAAGARCPRGLAGLKVPEAAASGQGAREAMARFVQAAERLGGCKLTQKAQEAMEPVLDVVRSYEALAPGQQTAELIEELLAEVKLPRSSKTIAEEHAEAKEALARAQVEAALSRSAHHAEQVIELAREVNDLLADLKRQRSLLDNDDLIDLALVAVREHPEIARDYAQRFRLVMVDEFQDTDTRQLELISLLAGPGAKHLCTVGDSQQSIYRFRGADVSVFREQGARLAEENHVELATNYRSHEDVLGLVERICGGTQDAPGALDDFMRLDFCPTRKSSYKAHDLPRIDIEASVGPAAYGKTSAAQTALMAAQIADALATYAAHGVQPSEMALLLGVTTHADSYIDALRARGIECVVTGGSTFSSAREVEVMCALLHTLANPVDTQSGLFRLLASEMFELDAGDFCLLGTRAQEKLDAPTKRSISQGIFDMTFYGGEQPSRRLLLAHEVLTAAWRDVGSLPVADVCLRVARDSGWLARLEAGGTEGKAKVANVLAAVRYIRDLTSSLGLGPARAASEFDRWLALAKIPPAALAGGGANMVRVMTVHASKGLEFPLVAVAECWGDAKAPSGFMAGPCALIEDGAEAASDDWLALLVPSGVSKLADSISEEEGETLKGSGPISLADAYKALRSTAQRQDQAEKARLLYVAMTRAEEALVLGLCCPMGKAGCVSELASVAAQTLVGGDGSSLSELPAGVTELSYGMKDPARLRVVQVGQTAKRGEPRVVTIDSAGTLPGADGSYVEPTSEELLYLGTPKGEESSEAVDGPAPFVLYRREEDPSAQLETWRAREGVFSYSSAHRVIEEEERQRAQEEPAMETPEADGLPVAAPAQATGRQTMPTVRERAAEAEGAPSDAHDADRATNLGSAFHELAQTMVETGREPSDEQIANMARYWNLSERAIVRLRDALGRWTRSDLRAEALGYDRLYAEMPFFVPATESLTRFGQHMEGAIDLLCCNLGSDGMPCGEALLIDYKTGDRNLTPEQIYERHEMQAQIYTEVLLSQGFESVTCAFVCVEVDAGELAGGAASGQPQVARYSLCRR